MVGGGLCVCKQFNVGTRSSWLEPIEPSIERPQGHDRNASGKRRWFVGNAERVAQRLRCNHEAPEHIGTDGERPAIEQFGAHA